MASLCTPRDIEQSGAISILDATTADTFERVMGICLKTSAGAGDDGNMLMLWRAKVRSSNFGAAVGSMKYKSQVAYPASLVAALNLEFMFHDNNAGEVDFEYLRTQSTLSTSLMNGSAPVSSGQRRQRALRKQHGLRTRSSPSLTALTSSAMRG